MVSLILSRQIAAGERVALVSSAPRSCLFVCADVRLFQWAGAGWLAAQTWPQTSPPPHTHARPCVRAYWAGSNSLGPDQIQSGAGEKLVN